jgi:hypothetical protein
MFLSYFEYIQAATDKPYILIHMMYNNMNFWHHIGDEPFIIRFMNLGYKYYLGHFSIHHEETVLFATAKR